MTTATRKRAHRNTVEQMVRCSVADACPRKWCAGQKPHAHVPMGWGHVCNAPCPEHPEGQLCIPNATAHGRAVASTVQQIVGQEDER
jgi:hypothetical protein